MAHFNEINSYFLNIFLEIIDIFDTIDTPLGNTPPGVYFPCTNTTNK